MDTVQTHWSRLTDLTADECWSLAAGQPVGRLAWTGPRGPTVVPVNFVVTGRQVHVRTAAYSVIARECDDSIVAFEVDQFHADDRSGWSVLMRGTAHIDVGAAGGDQVDPWPSGVRSLRLTVDVEQISGRRID